MQLDYNVYFENYFIYANESYTQHNGNALDLSRL